MRRNTRGLARCLQAAPLAALLAAPLASGLTACATTATPASSQLEGHWQLDSRASDDVTAAIGAAVSRAQAQLRKRMSGGTRASGPAATGASRSDQDGDADQSFDAAGDMLGNGLVLGPDFRALRSRLQQALATPMTLALQVHPGEVDIQRDSLPARGYQAGEALTLFDEYGTARVDSRWSGNVFEVRERYTSGAHLVQSYDIDSMGELVYRRVLQDPTVGTLTVRSVYRRR